MTTLSRSTNVGALAAAFAYTTLIFGAAIARSNSVVIVPSEKYPVLALQMYQVTRRS